MKRKIDVYLIQHIGRAGTFVVIGLAKLVRPTIILLGVVIGILAPLNIMGTSPVWGGILNLILIFLGTVVGSIVFVAFLIGGFLGARDECRDEWKKFTERYPARKRKEGE